MGKVKCGQSKIKLFYAMRATVDESFIIWFNLYRDMDPVYWALIENN